MQYTLTVSQTKALEWGLNAQQALLFAFVYECPSWAKPVKTEGGIFYALSKAKIIEELPLLTEKVDTAYRLLKQLEVAGVIELSHAAGITLVRLTDKGREWNKAINGSEKYPSKTGDGRKKIRGTSEKNQRQVGKKSDAGSEKSPTNQDTSNQDTNQGTSQFANGAVAPVAGLVEVVAPRVEIPADMPGPKDPSCKTFKTWANYAFAYRKRYGVWPVWNASAGGMIAKLIDQIGADEAPKVAAFYVSINDARLVNDCHGLNILIAKAGAYRTQWATGRQMNATTARQIEQTQANVNAAQEAAARIMARQEGGAHGNPFLR